MFSKNRTKEYTGNCSAQIERLKQALETADAVLIGAGAGLSTSAGLSYSGERFERYFSDFHQKYGITDMYSGGFYPYDTLEEYWAWWSRHIFYNRYVDAPLPVYQELLALVKDKNYFVLTTNVDHQFQRAGFDKNRLFYTQGDYGLWQCSRACHNKTYDNEDAVRQMIGQQKDMVIPSELIPRCPVCGAPMIMNLRCDDTFVQDEGWFAARNRYSDFVRRHKHGTVLYLELGVGNNTPVIIKYPFWKYTLENPDAIYACINFGQAYAPREIAERSVCLDADIGRILSALNRKAVSYKMDRASIMRDRALSTFLFSRRGIHTVILQFGYSQKQKMREVSKGGQRPPLGSGFPIGASSIPIDIGYPKGTACPLAHDFPQESLVCYTFVERMAARNAAHP